MSSSSRADSTELHKIRVLLILLYKNFYKAGQKIQLNNKLDYPSQGTGCIFQSDVFVCVQRNLCLTD